MRARGCGAVFSGQATGQKALFSFEEVTPLIVELWAGPFFRKSWAESMDLQIAKRKPVFLYRGLCPLKLKGILENLN